MSKFFIGEGTSKTEIDVNLESYIDLAGKTNQVDYAAVSQRMGLESCFRGIPVLINKLVEDLDTNLDSVKKYLFYGKPLKEDALPLTGLSDSLRSTDMSSFINNETMIDIFHGVIGQATEAGEMLKALVSYMETGSIDLVNLGEEVGDQNWYQALILKRAGLTFDNVMTTNIQKLSLRFPNGFTEDKAINRDITAERLDLESNLKTSEI